MNCSWLKLPAAAEALRLGGVLLLSTDTLPGIHCRADDEPAALRLARIKTRDEKKPLLVLAASLEQALTICGHLNPLQLEHCRTCWPGPFSLILPAGDILAPRVTCGLGTVAVRVPAEENLQRLILASEMPLVSTSVNLQDEEPILDMETAWECFNSVVDGVWNSFRPSPVPGIPSALVDLCGPQPRILRKGPLDFPCSD